MKNLTLIIKVISIDDLNVNIVELPHGTFLVDGEVVSNTGYGSYNIKHQIAAKAVEDIRAIYTDKILLQYTSIESDESLSVVDYETELQKLLSSSIYSEDECIWNNLDDEFAYRKFKQKWKPEYKIETKYSEPLLIDRSHILQNTGNPHIKAGFLTGQADTPLYSYSRTQAVPLLMAEKFKSLGMEFKDKLSYSQTEGVKFWSNSTHSGLEYVTAFGKYILGKQDLPKTKGEFKGSLEYLTDLYNKDKLWIESLVQVAYNLHFRNEAASGVLIKEVYDNIKSCITSVSSLDVKVKSETSKRSVLGKLDKLLGLVSSEVLK